VAYFFLGHPVYWFLLQRDDKVDVLSVLLKIIVLNAESAYFDINSINRLFIFIIIIIIIIKDIYIAQDR